MDKAAAAPFQLRRRGPEAILARRPVAADAISHRQHSVASVLLDGALIAGLVVTGKLSSEISMVSLVFSIDQSLKQIPLGPDLLGPFSDPSMRLAFLRQWQQAIGMKH